jgi:hypothetical protein
MLIILVNDKFRYLRKITGNGNRMMMIIIIIIIIMMMKRKVSKAIPVIGRASPWSCETSRIPNFLDNRLNGGGDVASLTPPPPLGRVVGAMLQAGRSRVSFRMR